MAISDKLQDLIDIKQDIKEAIENKGANLTGVAFSDYAEKIDEIPLPKKEQTKTVSSPDFSSGNVVVTPDAGKVLTQVVVVKDSDLVPENIVKNVNIFGVVGTAEAGGGGMTYEDYARTLYLAWGKSSQFASAWAHSLIVVTVSKTNYPNGATEGVIIPHGVTSIGGGAFYGWTSNNQPLVIPDSVTSIGYGAFEDWSSNNQPLVIPNSVTSIGNDTFRNWSSNNQPLVIPNSVTSIGTNAFRGWLSAPYIEIQAITPPTLASSGAFSQQNNAPIYVPDESVVAYKTATNWVSLASRIFPVSNK